MTPQLSSVSATGHPARRATLSQVDATKVAQLRRALIGPQAVAALSETFKVLGDVTRVRMLDALSKAELCVSDLAALLGLTESAVSHQLRLLRGMRLVRSRRLGRMVFYMLDDDHIVKLFRQGLDHVEESSGPAARG
jgi:ArsR family transcriptional regulator, lead/cadmium/zinc/bismuth-responsive transcriptional repressor